MIVLDCSAALEIAKNTEIGQALLGLVAPEEEIIAPSLFMAEITNAAWKHVHAGVLDEAHARELMEDALALPDRFVPMDNLLMESYAEGVALDHSAYDMLYLVLARRKGATLFTCDKKLQQCCAKRNVNCVEDVAF